VLLHSRSPANCLALRAQRVSYRADCRPELPRSDVADPSRRCGPRPDSVPKDTSWFRKRLSLPLAEARSSR
jgi:hypothetical protein